MSAPKRAESQFIIQWKVANAPKIRRRRRTKRQIEEDRLKALQEATLEETNASSSGQPQAELPELTPPSTQASSGPKTKVPILPKPAAAAKQDSRSTTTTPTAPVDDGSPPSPYSSPLDSISHPRDPATRFNFGVHFDPSRSSSAPPSYDGVSPYSNANAEDSGVNLLLNESLSFQKSFFNRSFPAEQYPPPIVAAPTRQAVPLLSSSVSAYAVHEPMQQQQQRQLVPALGSQLVAYHHHHRGSEVWPAAGPDHTSAWTSTTASSSSSSFALQPSSYSSLQAEPMDSSIARQQMHESMAAAKQLQRHGPTRHHGEAAWVEETESSGWCGTGTGSGSRKRKDNREVAMMRAAAIYAASCRQELSDDVPLYSFQSIRELMHIFQRCYWAFTPTDPSVMREENLRRMLITDRWENVGDPLLLNINIALAHGAHLLGATSVAEQYFERARKHLASLFDTNSYTVAEAMFSMGFYVYAQGKYDQFSYYVSLAMNACKQLNATNSMLYAKCLIAVNLDPTYSPDQKYQLVSEYNLGSPHSFPRGSPSRSSPSSLASSPPHLTHRAGDHSSSSPASDENGDMEELGIVYESDRDDSDVDLVDWDSHDEALLRRMLRKVESIDRYVLSMQMLHQLISFRKQEDPSADISSLVTSLQQLLHGMGSEFNSTKHLGSAFNTSVVLTWYAIASLQNLYCSRPQDALLGAIDYLEQAEREYHSAYCAASTIVIHQMMMDVFAMHDRYDLVKRLLLVVEPFVKIHPLARNATRSYWDAVHRHERREAEY